MLKNVYTVKQVNAYIKNMFTQDFMLNRLYVKGEVSNCKYHPSGHIYFSLKDESGTIACVMFAGSRSGLSFRMQEGQQVVVLGSVSVYERDGRYQMYAREIILDGAGELYLKFEALKKELEEMGDVRTGVQATDSAVCKKSRDRDCIFGSCGAGYHQYCRQKKSVCTADPLSCQGAGGRRSGKYRAGNPDAGRTRCGRYDRGTRRRINRGSVGIQ